MKEDCISSSTMTGSIRSAMAAIYGTASRIDEGFLRVLLDEVPPGLDVLAHEDAEHPVGRGGVFQRDPLEHTGLGVHGRFPQLLGLHLRQPLEPLDLLRLLAVAIPQFGTALVAVDVEILLVHL